MTDGTRPVVLVTGASGNLGGAIALAFASAGYDLVLHHRGSTEAAAAVAEHASRLDARVRTMQANLTDVSAIRRMFASVTSDRLDVLVNCAGSFPSADFLSSPAEEWLESYSLHVVAALTCIQSATPLMENGGSVINIASIAAHRSAADDGPYAASKAALLSLTRSAALALADRGIRVNAVSPGLIWRDDLDTAWPEGLASWSARAPLVAPVAAAEVAASCVFLAGATSITGQELVVDAGISAQRDY